MIYGTNNINNQPVQNLKYDLSNNKVESFNNIMQAQKCGYSKFVTELQQIYTKSFSGSYFNEIDILKVPLWTRKDFPKYLTFDKYCTQENLNKIKMPYEEPAFSFDPEVQNVWGDIVKENGVSFIVHPKAAEKINSDPAFYKKVMENVLNAVPINIREMVAADFKAIGSTLIDLSVFITIGENGEVSFDGYCSGVPEIKSVEEQEEQKYDIDNRTCHQISNVAFNEIISNYNKNNLTFNEIISNCNKNLEIYNNLAYLAAEYSYRKKK